MNGLGWYRTCFMELKWVGDWKDFLALSTWLCPLSLDPIPSPVSGSSSYATITPKSLLHAEQYFTLLCEALRFRGAEIYENLINLIKMLWGKSLNQRVADGKMNYQAFLPCLAGCLWANWVTAKLWAEMFYSLSKYIHFIVHSILWARGKGKVAIPKVTKSAYNRWAIMGVFRP